MTRNRYHADGPEARAASEIIARAVNHAITPTKWGNIAACGALVGTLDVGGVTCQACRNALNADDEDDNDPWDPLTLFEPDDEPKPLDRTVRQLICAECGTRELPMVVSSETEVCLACHDAVKGQ